MGPFLLSLVVLAFAAIIEKISPEIREWLIEFIAGLEEKADATPNKFDDKLVDALKAIIIGPDK